VAHVIDEDAEDAPRQENQDQEGHDKREDHVDPQQQDDGHESDQPTDTFLKELSGMTWLLALVTPCNMGGQDVIQELTSYSTQVASVITDACSIRAVIGHVHSCTEWTIIDRSSAISHAAFVVDDADDSDDNGLI
jgi:hypothetical protein